MAWKKKPLPAKRMADCGSVLGGQHIFDGAGSDRESTGKDGYVPENGESLIEPFVAKRRIKLCCGQLFWRKPEKCNGGIIAERKINGRTAAGIRRNVRPVQRKG